MIFKKIKYVAVLVAVIASGCSALAARRSVKASMDSSQIVMGQQTAIRFDIVDSKDSPSQLLVDKSQLPPEVEAVDWIYGDTTDIGNDLVEMKRALIIQSFDSGAYEIPPFMLVNGPDTVRSNMLTLKVVPVDVSAMKDINPIASPLEFESRWYDIFPDWLTDYWVWYLLGLLVIAGGVCAYLILTKKVEVNILPQKKRLPPYQIAINRLQALKEAGLWEQGQEKEYYTQLTDILREYLEERFGINAMEMTSTQIIHALAGHEATRTPNQYMKKILEVADFVKFAKVRPMPDDNLRAFNNAMQFVEDTKPVESVDANNTHADSDVSEADASAAGIKRNDNSMQSSVSSVSVQNDVNNRKENK